MDIFLNTKKKYDIQSSRYIKRYSQEFRIPPRLKFCEKGNENKYKISSFCGVIVNCNEIVTKELIDDYYHNSLQVIIPHLIKCGKYTIANHILFIANYGENISTFQIHDLNYIHFFRRKFNVVPDICFFPLIKSRKLSMKIAKYHILSNMTMMKTESYHWGSLGHNYRCKSYHILDLIKIVKTMHSNDDCKWWETTLKSMGISYINNYLNSIK